MVHRWLAVTVSIVVVLLGQGPNARAQTDAAAGDRVTLTLKSGEILRGVLVKQTEAQITLEHPLLGTIRIPAGEIAQVQSTPSAEQVPAETEPAGQVEEILEKTDGTWASVLEAGISGSSGNSDRFNARVRFGATYTSEHNIFDFYTLYLYSEEDSQETQNRAEFGAKNDFLFEDSPWRLFVRGLLEYDEQTSYTYRLSGGAGVGYAFFQTDELELVGRAGIGASREWGSDNDSVVPEGFLGIDLKHKLNARQSIYATAEYFPSFDDLSEFRARLLAGWEVQVDEKGNLFLKIGIEDRYTEAVDVGTDRNDIDYFLALTYKF